MISRPNKPTKIYYAISMRNSYGTYKAIIKEFNDHKHFSNWYSYVCRNGGKKIGTTKVESLHSDFPQGL